MGAKKDPKKDAKTPSKTPKKKEGGGGKAKKKKWSKGKTRDKLNNLVLFDNDAIAVHLKSGNHPRISHKDYNRFSKFFVTKT